MGSFPMRPFTNSSGTVGDGSSLIDVYDSLSMTSVNEEPSPAAPSSEFSRRFAAEHVCICSDAKSLKGGGRETFAGPPENPVA